MITVYDINTSLPLATGDTLPIVLPRRRFGWRVVVVVASASFLAAFLGGAAIGWWLVATGRVVG